MKVSSGEMIKFIKQCEATTSILCPEQLFEVIDNHCVNSPTIIFLACNDIVPNERPVSIIPTLSLIKLSRSQCCLLNSYNCLWAEFKKKNNKLSTPSVGQAKSIAVIQKTARELKYQFKFFKGTRICALIENLDSQPNFQLIKSIALALNTIVLKSQNIINESRKLADRDRKLLVESLSENLEDAAEKIASFVSNKYNVEAKSLDYSSKGRMFDLTNIRVSESLREIINSNEEQLIEEKKPLSSYYEGKYFFLFPFISSLVERDFRSLIFIESIVPIPEFIGANLTYFTNFYFAVFLEKVKRNVLETLRLEVMNTNSVITMLIDSGEVVEIEKLVPRVLEKISNLIVDSTNAISVSFRLLDPDTDKLKLFYSFNAKSADVINSKYKNDINARDHHKSQVAKTFWYSTWNSAPNYISDLTKLKKNHDSTYIEHRKNAMSELCFAIFYQKIAIGTLNFESSIKDGFKHELEFFKSIRDSLQAYIESIYIANDKHWLARRSQVYQNLHEIKTIISAPTFPQDERSRISQFIISNETIESSTKLSSFKELNRRIYELMDSYTVEFNTSMPAFMRNDSKKAIIEHVFVNLQIEQYGNFYITRYRLNLIMILIKNIFDNFRKHGLLGKDNINIDFLQDSSLIHISAFSKSAYSQKHEKQILIEPYTSVTDGEETAHYGAFIIGMIARHLGGYARLKTDRAKNTSRLNVYLPMELVKDENEKS